ncbi:MAG: tRNA glutamyl-Q(34) synthetase GluQRS [Robiginitomaculum sp.]|nr:MAG: tRNA glutamyl-Q(34) synthetase GluQRS [Robiginitomaculum sp.]
MSSRRTRFAPSPTGLLHLGHAASALRSFDWASANSAQFLLRIEDIDQPRCRSEFESAIYDDLRWLGLSWTEPVRKQSEHIADFATALDILIEQGVLYPCFLTRREVAAAIASAPHGPTEIYLGPEQPMSASEQAARLAEGQGFAWRLSLEAAKDRLGPIWNDMEWQEHGIGPDDETGLIQADPTRLGDVILARKDIATSYHLAVTHDDALQGITDVVRGLDLFESTHIHVLLQALLGWQTPVYHHHSLLLDEQGKRLAKRDGAMSLRALREAGTSAAQARKLAGL